VDRQVYTIVDCVEDFGGFASAVVAIFTLLFSFIIDFKYNSSLIERIFLKQIPKAELKPLMKKVKRKLQKKGAETDEEKEGQQHVENIVFNSMKNKSEQEDLKNSSTIQQKKNAMLKQYQSIKESLLCRIPFRQDLKMYFESKLTAFKCCLRRRKSEVIRQKMLFDEATDLLNRELDIVQLIRRLRKLNVIEKLIFSKQQRVLIRYSNRNVINHLRKPKEKRIPYLHDKKIMVEAVNNLQDKPQFDLIDMKILKDLMDEKDIDLVLRKGRLRDSAEKSSSCRKQLKKS